MALDISREQYSTSRQTIQTRFIKIELLNYQYQTVDSLEGVSTSGNIGIDSNSDIRRTGSIGLTVTDSSFEVTPGNKIWLDKYLRVCVGIRSLRTGQISWTNCGLFIIDAPNYHYDSVSHTLTLSLLDLMAKTTGIRNGNLKGLPVLIASGEDIRKTIIGILEMAGFKNYIIDSAPGPVPFDMRFEQGATVYDLLKALVDIYPNYEMYFDVNGTFIYRRIPDGNDDPILVDDSTWGAVVVSEDTTVDFQNVKNSIEIYGRTHDPSYFAETAVVEGNNIKLDIKGVSAYSENIIYGFTLKDNAGIEAPIIQVNELEQFPALLGDNATPAFIKEEKGEVYYCIQFKGDHWYWLGHLQAYAELEDNDPKSPFNVNGTVGRIRLPLFGDIYENIFTDELAEQRAEYELYLHSKLNNSITLNCIPVYWLDVNIKVEYSSKRNNQKEQYIIKSVNFGLAPTDTMTVQMMRFYPNI